MSEEERAAQYRRGQQAGQNALLARYQALKGNATALAALRDKTDALRRDPSWDPVARLTGRERAVLP